MTGANGGAIRAIEADQRDEKETGTRNEQEEKEKGVKRVKIGFEKEEEEEEKLTAGRLMEINYFWLEFATQVGEGATEEPRSRRFYGTVQLQLHQSREGSGRILDGHESDRSGRRRVVM